MEFSSSKCTVANRSRSWTKLVLTRYLHCPVAVSRDVLDFTVSIVSELISPCSALWIGSSRKHNKHTRFCVSGLHKRIKRSSMFGSSLHIFSPNSTLLCCHNLLVVKFPQVVVPPNWAHKDFAHEVRLLWILPPDCLCLSRIQFSTRYILRISDVSRRSLHSQFLNFPWETQPWTFRRATDPRVPSSWPRAEVALTISLSTQATIASNASVSRLVSTTHGMMSIITQTILSSWPP